MKYIDMFGGIGGFRLGITIATDWECVWYNDKNRYATSVYNLRFGEKYEPTNIGEVDEGNIPRHDCICAGFPCQSFSVAGKRKGFEDTRGTLFYEICRIAEFHKPRWLFLENVRGLLSHDGGQTFARILNALQDLGYGVEWQVCNSKRHGVPQNRERVFIVGHLGGFRGQQVFPIRGTDREGAGKNSDWQPVARCIDKNYHKGWLDHGQRTMILSWQNKKDGVVPKGECPSLRASGGTDIRKSPKVLQHSRDEKGDVVGYNERDVAGTLKQPSGNQQNYVIYDDYNQRVKQDGIVPAVRQTNCRRALGNASKLIGNRRIRRLTPLECERLQGFPDMWTRYGVMDGELVWTSDTQRYKMLGNAVTVNVIADIAAKMDRVLKYHDGGEL